MKTFFLSWITTLLIMGASCLNAQILDYNNKIGLTLGDGTNLLLYGKAVSLSEQISSDYYYLPTNLHLGKKTDGTPEFLFIKYTTEERVDAGGAQGAIMHFLMEWGLTPEQLKEATVKLQQLLRSNTKSVYARVVNPRIMGPVDVSAAENGSFKVISATLSDDKSAKLITSGRASTVPGGKTAVASKMDKIAAQLFAATLEKNRSITDLSLELQFKYNVLFPAVKGRIVMNWDKIHTVFENASKGLDKNDEEVLNRYKISHIFGKDEFFNQWDKTGKKIISETEARSVYDYLREIKAIDIQIDKNVTESAIADQVIESFMNVFMQSISDANKEQPEESEDKKDMDSTTDPDLKKQINDAGEVHYTFNKSKFTSKSSKKREEYNLTLRIAIPMFHSLTGNLASWYDGVKNNKKCVSSVNLNDKFFQHRDINFIIDNKVKDIFEQEVNYVTINVRKKRSSGNDFQEQATIDLEHLKSKGAIARFTYARSDDNNPDMYEYKTQWSLRGGTLYPSNPDWQQGDWQGVTLTCPMVPRNIQFEADLEEMKQLGFVRASLQLRYMKYGKEVESNIPITVSQGVALAEKKLFIDENIPGYAYRIILTHKEKGKMALDWDSKLNDDYVYAILPKQLKDGDPGFIQKLSDAAKLMLETSNGEVKPENKILFKFLDAIKIFVKDK
ncbi:MAG: hypothetical protein SH818_19075 [Saprospiraceae bacterium]|nr:hypothetical protein [Saprospiraceae bacterium]